MTEHRLSEAERALARDLEALRAVTARDVPDIHDTASALTQRAAYDTREGWLMKSIRIMKARPWITTGVVTAVLAALLLVVPVSYQRTVGHDVTLKLAGSLDRDSLRKISSELRTAVGAEGVRIALLEDEGGNTTELVANSPSRSGAEMRAKAAAFAKALGSRGITATAEVTPRLEKVSTNLYAYAADQAIELRIDRAGKTPAEMEADIRAQLEAAGIQNPTVSVTQEGDQTKVQIEAQSEGSEPGEQHEFRINVDGQGTDPLDAQIHRFEVNRTPGMTDADVKAEIERQMREAGVEGTVTVQDGKIEVEIEHREQH